MAPYADLNNDDHFPTWDHLPAPDGTWQPQQHWCFLAQIVQCDGFMRYRTVVKDDNDEQMVVAFYLDDYEAFDFNKMKPGHTLAIMHAAQHGFLDGTYGVRVEDVEHFHKLQWLGPKMNQYAVEAEPGKYRCQGCDAVKASVDMNRCAGCRLYCYCDKDCQKKGWNDKGHKQECKVLRDPNFMSMMKFDFSSSPYGPTAFQFRHG